MTEGLEHKVEDKESKGWMKKAFDLGLDAAIAAGTTALSIATVGTAGMIVGGALAAGGLLGSMVKGESLYSSIRKSLHSYSAVNAVIWPIVSLGAATFPLFPASDTLIGYFSRSIYATTLYNAAFVGAFKGAHHLAANHLNPSGIVDAVAKDFVKDWAIIGTLFAPGYILDANGIGSIMGIPTFAYNALPVGLLKESGIADKAYNFIAGNDGEKKEKAEHHEASAPAHYYDPRLGLQPGFG
ncbi:hypothetical protein HYU14_02975 [Candidatus Woesearchaeota archaeon]|nr:hypothetical protein [Candidatus Woesearchaeota archaeon]